MSKYQTIVSLKRSSHTGLIRKAPLLIWITRSKRISWELNERSFCVSNGVLESNKIENVGKDLNGVDTSQVWNEGIANKIEIRQPEWHLQWISWFLYNNLSFPFECEFHECHFFLTQRTILPPHGWYILRGGGQLARGCRKWQVSPRRQPRDETKCRHTGGVPRPLGPPPPRPRNVIICPGPGAIPPRPRPLLPPLPPLGAGVIPPGTPSACSSSIYSPSSYDSSE